MLSDALAILCLLLVHIGFMWRALLLRGFLAHSDILYFFEPAKALMHEALRAGRLPLWSPYIFCGYPIAAEGQIAAFYPLGLLISWLLPSPAAINWLIVSHLMLVAVGMYLLARSIGLRPIGAWLSAVVLSFSGYLFAHTHHVSLICAAAWLPWVLLFVERAWRGRLLPNAIGAAMAWGASALCGHPQTLFHISVMVIFWVVWRAVQTRRGSREAEEPRSAQPHPPSPSPRAERGRAAKDHAILHNRGVRFPTLGLLPRALALSAVVFALGAGLACVQLLMTSDLSKLAPHGDRGTLEYVTSFSLLPRHLVGLVAPNWQGTPADNTYRGERYYWEYVLYIGLVPLALAIIGATRRKGWVWAGLAVAALVLALAEGNPIYHLLRFVPGFSDFRVPARSLFLFTFAAAILAGHGLQVLTSWRLIAQGRRATLAVGLLVLVTVADLFLFDRTLAPLASPDVFAATPRVVSALKQDPTWGRSLIVTPIPIYADWSPQGGWAANPNGWLEARVYLPADVPQSFDLPIVGGYAGFVDPRHAQFFDEAMKRASSDGDYSLYSLVGARHFVLPSNLPLTGLPSADVPPFQVHLNRDAFPRSFAVGELTGASTDDEAREVTSELAQSGRLRSAAVVRGAAGLPGGAACEVLEVKEPRLEHITVRARSDGDALVVLNERWDPGWRARVDGVPAPLYETDCVLMGVRIRDGDHTVEFLYQPRGLIIGRAVSLASLTLCLLILALSLRRRRRED